ncbi:ATP synthase F0 subcomplex subunit OSCP atp5 [Nowakowskiella sp. JEL0078]|nr:ATP synthase F0 subcomplex subunit OSCP atp5 [Nowakowskiella sp. JEL0078]
MQSVKGLTLVRRYATSASTVPLTLHGIDGRYATALFTAAAKNNTLDLVETELNQFKSLFAREAGIKRFLETPILDRKLKIEGIKIILADGSAKYSQITSNLFAVLAENGRLDQTSKIIDAYLSLMTAHRGEVNVTVTSAKQLDTTILNKLKATLQKSSLIESTQKALITNKVDPSILSGIIIEVGGQTIDFSVSSRINKMNRLLTQAI